MESQPEMGISIDIGPSGITPHLHQPRERFIFRHEHEPILVQLSEQILTVNVLAPYPGWNRMKPTVLKVWQRASRAIQAESINRVGLRYINRLLKQSEGEKAGEWLRPNDYISPAILGSFPGFFSRVQARIDAHHRIVVTVADESPGESAQFGAIIFDIDRIIEQVLPASRASLGKVMDRLYEDVWSVFDRARTERLTKWLEGVDE